MRLCVDPVAGLLLSVLAVGDASAGDEVAMPALSELSVESYDEIHHRPRVLTIELRADAAVGAAMLPLARRPEAVGQDEIPVGCVAVLIIRSLACGSSNIRSPMMIASVLSMRSSDRR